MELPLTALCHAKLDGSIIVGAVLSSVRVFIRRLESVAAIEHELRPPRVAFSADVGR